MTTPWLSIVGIGEDGLPGLSATARGLVEGADVLFGGKRHLNFVSADQVEKVSWSSPLSSSFDALDARKGQQVTVLASGDPMWFGIAATLVKRYGPDEMRIVPAPSAFALASARMVWPLDGVECRTIHGRAAENLRTSFFPDARILALTHDQESPSKVASMLCEDGFGQSRMTVLAHMGGKLEQQFSGLAEDWDRAVPDFHTLAIEVVADQSAIPRSRTPGLPDAAFIHDGKLTKQDIRAATLARLMPFPGQQLWDVGAGCGSIGIEWMRAAKAARATAFEPQAERRRTIVSNALALGIPDLEIIGDKAPECLGQLSSPDAIFIGGGLTAENMVATCYDKLAPGGRLVANAVTLESETVLLSSFRKYGGALVRLSIAHASSVGGFHGWRPAMPVTQWSLIKQ
ncbi:MAG: precorrin-6y C5,15-methyltransferase (decarboxylating) subunit CbiE [Stappiaceae bacterium]